MADPITGVGGQVPVATSTAVRGLPATAPVVASQATPTTFVPAAQPTASSVLSGNSAINTGYDAGSAGGGGVVGDIISSLVGSISGKIKNINDQMITLIKNNGGQLDAGTAASFTNQITEQSNTLEFIKKMRDEQERGMRAWLQ